MKRFIIGLAILAIGLTGCSATGGAPRASSASSTNASSPPPWLHPVVTAPPPALGDVVRNGTLRFRVEGTRRTTTVHDQFGGFYQTDGRYEYVIVTLTVQNVDTHEVFFYYDAQTLDLHGQQVSTASAATNALNPAVTPIIQPGLAIPVELAFVVAEGAQPEAIMLSDALYAISNPLSARATRVALVKP